MAEFSNNITSSINGNDGFQWSNPTAAGWFGLGLEVAREF